MKRIFIGLVCIFLLFQIGLTNQLTETSWQELFAQSIDFLYNCEYDKAIEHLEEAGELNPNNPAIYWRLTFTFWFKAEHDKSLEKEDKKELEKKFNQMFDRGVALCDSNSTDSEILFYLGGLYGNEVFFEQAIGSTSPSLIKKTNKSREYLRQIEEGKDFYSEACGYLGIFNYGPLIVPKFWMWIAEKKGYKYDIEKGLRQIKDAMEHSRYSDDIKFLYEGILLNLVKKKKYRNRIQEAMDLVNELLEKYPRNSFLKEDLKILKDL